jgi:formylglycine-generating enzyme required for sulfatase activity
VQADLGEGFPRAEKGGFGKAMNYLSRISMFRVTSGWFGLGAMLAVCTTVLLGSAWAQEELPVGFDPNEMLSLDVLKIFKPGPETQIPEAEAKTEAEMKPYTEVIPGTDIKIEMVPIPGGKFLMGSPPDEPGRREDEGPQIEVEIEPFWMSKYEITWEQYDAWALKLDAQYRKLRRERENRPQSVWEKMVDAIARPTAAYTDMTFGMGREGYPAICMTQYAARYYCKWLTINTGRYYRLPTEAEWEYACRAGTTTAYYFGDDPDKLGEYAWYFENSNDKYQRVGRKKPNPWGLYDMHGNVSEWVMDQYVPDFYRRFVGKTVKNPWAVPKEEYPIVVRGGSWDDDPEDCRSAARRGSHPDWKMQDPQIPQSIWYLTDAPFVGFRIIRPLRWPTPEEAKLFEPDPQILKDYIKAQGGKR